MTTASPAACPSFAPFDIVRYRRDGYVVVPQLFRADDLAVVEGAIARVARSVPPGSDGGEILEFEPESAAGNRLVRRIHDPCERDPAFLALAAERRLLDRVEALIGPHLALQHSKLNMKPPRVGSVVEWHQDLAYFPHTNDDLLAALIYLDDATEDNGCLQVVPGMHAAFLDHTRPDGTFAGMITGEFEIARARPLPAPAGSVILMHCLTPHSSLPNRSQLPRRTLIFEYRAADAFPIHYGPHVARSESMARHLRGQRATIARFGGPAPAIPRLATPMASLYEMQSRAKRRDP